jgi:microcystin-dependent protein
MGVNMEGELAVGELQLAATDPGLLALATALAGVTTPKTLLSLYNLFAAAGGESGITVKTLPAITGTVAVTNVDTPLNALFTSTGIKVTTLPDAANAVLTAVKDQLSDYLAVREAPSTTLVSGTNTSMPANGASAGVALTSTQACAEVTIQAPTTNTVIVLFGSSASTCVMQLAPGRDFTIPASNVNKIFVMSSTADTTPVVNWLARA